MTLTYIPWQSDHRFCFRQLVVDEVNFSGVQKIETLEYPYQVCISWWSNRIGNRHKLQTLTYEKCSGHVRKLLTIVSFNYIKRWRNSISDDVIHVICTRRSRVTQPHGLNKASRPISFELSSILNYMGNNFVANLNRRGSQCKNLVSSAFCVSVQVQQNVDSILINSVRCFSVTSDLTEIYKVFRLVLDLVSECCAIVCTQGVAKDLHVILKSNFSIISRMTDWHFHSKQLH